MDKQYTTKTSSLKATTADIYKVESKVIDSKEIKLDGVDILDLIDNEVSQVPAGFQVPEDFKKLVKRCELPEGSNYILWTDTGQIAYMSFADKLINGSDMFRSTALASWNIDLPRLTNGEWMFSNTPLQSFIGDLSSLTNGYAMFAYCTALESFSGDLSSLENGFYMFAYSALQSFNSDLSNLADGDDMFCSCKLDLTSVQNIASTINTVSSGNITLGIQSSLQGNTELETAINVITSKGWEVTTQYNA